MHTVDWFNSPVKLIGRLSEQLYISEDGKVSEGQALGSNWNKCHLIEASVKQKGEF